MTAKKSGTAAGSSLDLSVSINKRTGEVQAVYIQVRTGKAAEVREYGDGAVFANYDATGNLLGIELLAPCKVEVLNRITRKLPQGPSRDQARRLIRTGVPGGMLVGAY